MGHRGATDGLPKAKRNGRMISNIYSARLMAQPASPLAPLATAAVLDGLTPLRPLAVTFPAVGGQAPPRVRSS
jgi:hypothetical protein